ncbi:MAG: DUF4479 domain-containing protein [Bacilli bacterium]|nr:DUF4479 domain-containing protein [Bacilli bacterium]
MQRLFYNLKITGDVVYVLIKPAEYPDRVEKKADVAMLYKGDELVGINIFNIFNIVKIHSEGMIVTPDDKLIDVLNVKMDEAGFPHLSYCRDSGYKIARIAKLEEHPLDEKAHIVTLDLGDKTLETTSRYQNLEEGGYIVVAIDGTIKFDGTEFKGSTIKNIGHYADICSGKELRINDDYKNAFIAEGYKAGDDFFLAGE